MAAGSLVWNRRKLPKHFNGKAELERLFPERREVVQKLIGEVGFKEALWRLLVQERTVTELQIQWLPGEKSRDALYLWQYKVNSCERVGCDPALCFDSHSTEDSRRALSLHSNGLWSYKSAPCKGAQLCSGVTCTLANTSFEEYYHPTRYRTMLCPYRQNILGICALGIHCPNAHDTTELRTASPNIVTLAPEWGQDHIVSDLEEDISFPATQQEVAHFSLSELLRTKLSPVTHEMIEGLQAAQHEKLRCDLQLREAQQRIENIQRKTKCGACHVRKRSRLLSCGHQLCDSCVQTHSSACPFCSRAVVAVLLKEK